MCILYYQIHNSKHKAIDFLIHTFKRLKTQQKHIEKDNIQATGVDSTVTFASFQTLELMQYLHCVSCFQYSIQRPIISPEPRSIYRQLYPDVSV